MARKTRSFGDGLGAEPNTNTEHMLTDMEIGNALTWYQSKNYRNLDVVSEWMKTLNYRSEEINKVLSREKHLESSIFAICRLVTSGCKIPQEFLARHEARVNAHIKAAEVEEKPVAKPAKLYKNPRLDKLIMDLETAHDYIVVSNGYVTFNLNFVPDEKEKLALDIYYRPKMEELISVRDKTDPELVQAYRNLSANTLSRLIDFYGQIVTMEETKKEPVERKPRKKRKPTFNKLKYLVEDEGTGLKSVAPDTIHGCSSTLIVYNTKYESVTVYVAEEGKFLEFKRTSVINFDEAKSFTKRAGRSKTLVTALKTLGTKKNLLQEINNINSKPTKASSLISDCVILVKGFWN